jgi:acetyl esterase/lipase
MPNPTSPPESIKHAVDTALYQSDNDWNVFQITPREVAEPDRHIFYIHGGAFVHYMLEQHWKAMATIAVASGAAVTVPAYPLAAEGTAKVVPSEMTNLLEGFMEEAGADRTFLMGDSAGGNIALTTATLLRDRQAPLPARTILISPWLDLELADATSDVPGMNLGRLRQDAHVWRGNLEFSDPLVSPINAALHGLGKVTVFCGTEDLLNPGCLHLGEIASGQPGTTFELYESLGAGHSHVLSNTSAGAQARTMICDIIRGAPDLY